MTSKLAISALLTCLTGSAGMAFAQGANTVDGAGLVDLSLKAVSQFKPADRQTARTFVGYQIAQLPQSSVSSAVTELIAKIGCCGAVTETDALTILEQMPTPWTTANTTADADHIYTLYQQATNTTLKALLDGALANAQGLYRDGIADYNVSDLTQFTQAPAKLKAMAQRYPGSEYAEKASFYLGQYYIKAYFLEVAPVDSQIANSNAAFESYIADIKSFPTKGFYPAGYFFRSLNGWIANNPADALKWLNAGLGQNFTDNDVVYVYQLFYHTTTIDKYLPAKTLFTNTVKFFSTTPPPVFGDPNSAANALIADVIKSN